MLGSLALRIVLVVGLGLLPRAPLGEPLGGTAEAPNWAASRLTARAEDLPLEAALHGALRQEFARQELVGLAVAVVVEDEIDEFYFGFADREARTPVGPSTMFRWASISKPLVAVRAVQLAEAGRLDLDDDVRVLVPEFPVKPWPVTARQLAGHLGGVVHYSNGEVIVTERSEAEGRPLMDTVAALDRFKESPLVCEPGSRYSYSTHGYMLLGAAVARAGEGSLREQVDEFIAAPLGMASLQPDDQGVSISGRARGYRRVARQVVPSLDRDVSWKLAGGGFISTVGDLARFARGLMGDDLLPRPALDRMWTPLRLSSGERTSYGLGFSVASVGGERTVRHTGSQEKTRTLLSVRPDSGRAVVVMTNSEFGRVKPVASLVWGVLEQRR